MKTKREKIIDGVCSWLAGYILETSQHDVAPREVEFVGLFDSYDNRKNRFEAYAVEGDPPRGWVIVLPQMILCYDRVGRLVGEVDPVSGELTSRVNSRLGHTWRHTTQLRCGICLCLTA